jgi:hypothetical protein
MNNEVVESKKLPFCSVIEETEAESRRPKVMGVLEWQL